MWLAATIVLWVTGLVMLPAHTNGYWTPKMAAWLAGGSGLLALSLTRPVSTKPVPLGSWWLAGLVAWVSGKFLIINCWSWLWLTETADRFPYRLIISTVIPTVTCLVSIGVWRVLVQATDSPQRWVRIGVQVCAYATVVAVYGLVQVLGLDPLLIITSSTAGSLGTRIPITVFGNPMLTANMLAICAPLCLAFKPKWCRLSYGLILLNLVLIRSAASLAAVVVGSSLVWGFRRQWHWMRMIGGGGIVGLLWLLWTHRFLEFFSFSGRWEMWTKAMTVWAKIPWDAWMGYQLGAIEAATSHGFWNYGSLHCEPLQVLFELGIVGFVLTGGLLWQLLRRAWRVPKDTLLMGWLGSAASYAIIACFSFPLRVGALLMLGVFIVAAIEALMEDATHAYPA